MSPYPELRHDLVVREHRQADQTVFVVKDPVSEKFFRFVSFKYYVATLLDGNRSPEDITQAVSDRLRRPIRRETIETFVQRLQTYGLLGPFEWSPDFVAKPIGGSRKSKSVADQKNLLFYAIPLVNPHRMFDRLYPWVRFCFTGKFVAFSVLWVLAAAWGLMTDWDLYEAQIYRFELTPESLVSVYVFLIVTLTIHELAHGMACRHYGGRVSKIGFLMLYLQLGVYTDVSDSYLFSRKRSRMVVMLAGMITGLLIIATMAILWRITDESTWIHRTSFILMAVTGWSVFFNLNPLIKLDGYYILSDWVDIPNLRQKAFDHLKNGARRVMGFATSYRARVSSRERWIFLVYGTLAATYSVALIALLSYLVKDFVVEYAPELAMAGFLFGVVAMAVQSPPDDASDAQDNARRSARPYRYAPSEAPTGRLVGCPARANPCRFVCGNGITHYRSL